MLGVAAGVTEANWRPLMRSVSSLAELADTPLDTLADIMGGQASHAETAGWQA